MALLLVGAAFLASAAQGAHGKRIQWPALPLFDVDPWFHAFLMGRSATTAPVQSWYGETRELHGMVRVDGEAFRFLGACTVSPAAECAPALEQVSWTLGTTRTAFEFRTPSRSVRLRVNFVSTMYADEPGLMSRPVFYVVHDVASLDGLEHDVEVYFDASAEHCTRDRGESVTWSEWSNGGLRGMRLGTVAQDVLGSGGDRTNINWGFLYLAVDEPAAAAEATATRELGNMATGAVVVSGGGALRSRRAFRETGALARSEAGPRAAGGATAPEKAVVASIGRLKRVGKRLQRHTVMLGYDDVASALYYGEQMQGLWTRHFSGILDAIAAARREADKMLVRAVKHEKTHDRELSARGGPDYAAFGRMAYRQTLGAIKVVWSERAQAPWCFLKEISTNGDMNTVDVVFPASPMLLHHNPDLLKQLLVPVLEFANNGTHTPYTKPYCPHEIGVYPRADHTTAQQEPMPMENTGNMFLMILGVLQREGARNTVDAASWLYPRYWPLLSWWAEYLRNSLPFPEDQLCTDDFNGRLANNTNLAAKGIVALEAFAETCRLVGASGCAEYSESAKALAARWVTLSHDPSPLPHSTLVFGRLGTWSTKYNLVWQLLLGLAGPFPLQVFRDEVAFYEFAANRFGTPLDSRNANAKLDWLSWAAAMSGADDGAFRRLMAPIYAMANETAMRAPLLDLYDTTTGVHPGGLHDLGFRDRPVVGAVFAKMLLPVPSSPGPSLLSPHQALTD